MVTGGPAGLLAPEGRGDLLAPGGPGAYVHIPFCARRCDYCDFATWDDRSHLVGSYMQAVAREIEQAVEAGMSPVATVFFGGGTPSLVPAGALCGLLSRIPVADGAEVTVECNPESVSPASLAAYRQAGVTRLSFGVQSLSPEVLGCLGRTHDPAKVVRAFEWAGGEGFAGVSADLIFGSPAETNASWAATLAATLALGPSPVHVSAYGLTVEPGTPLARDPARHPDPDRQAERYIMAEEAFGRAGLSWYEVSNWARPGEECRHNLNYWAGGNYLGFGCAAHSHVDGRRWWNIRRPERYIEAITSGRSPVAGAEELDAATRESERLMLALRTRAGVPEEALAGEGAGAVAHLVDFAGGRAVLNLQGRLLANEVAARLVPPRRPRETHPCLATPPTFTSPLARP
ncbi:MAG: radical SAM family heme chaperone HemW [Acidimicrobiales bacterium]